MINIDINTSLGKLVTDNPASSRVFENLGLDFCCGGKSPLKDACEERGLDPQKVIELLRENSLPAGAAVDVQRLTLTELADHIEQTHHVYLRSELPRISAMAAKVTAAHGRNYPEVAELENTFDILRNEIESHMMKEEQILFPFIRELDAGGGGDFHCGSVQNPIFQMEREHEAAGGLLAAMRKTTNDYTLPSDACNTYRALLDALQTLEKDLHLHIHKENNILFPKAVERESGLA